MPSPSVSLLVAPEYACPPRGSTGPVVVVGEFPGLEQPALSVKSKAASCASGRTMLPTVRHWQPVRHVLHDRKCEA